MDAIIQYISSIIFKVKLKKKKKLPTIHPYYQNFKGTIIKVTPTKHILKGVYKVLSGNKVHITELPIGVWTDDYKQFLEKSYRKENNS